MAKPPKPGETIQAREQAIAAAAGLVAHAIRDLGEVGNAPEAARERAFRVLEEALATAFRLVGQR